MITLSEISTKKKGQRSDLYAFLKIEINSPEATVGRLVVTLLRTPIKRTEVTLGNQLNNFVNLK